MTSCLLRWASCAFDRAYRPNFYSRPSRSATIAFSAVSAKSTEGDDTMVPDRPRPRVSRTESDRAAARVARLARARRRSTALRVQLRPLLSCDDKRRRSRVAGEWVVVLGVCRQCREALPVGRGRSAVRAAPAGEDAPRSCRRIVV